ncbi:hypothetical protein ILYODFUR_006137 [Ilyodon furcidens]|uniref:BAAT/Acyl-CoA thioester hydrolase C-terminal domain-containing protein n=1 Tax=Ilyodon furcidens TaxID=33524 RepID=A0ABV0VC07_9TELE
MSLIPIERASCQFLFAVSEDGYNWNSVFYFFAKQAAAALRCHDKKSFQLVTYPRAGQFHLGVWMDVVFGGEPKAHAEVQLDLWHIVQQFFKRYLVNKDTF